MCTSFVYRGESTVIGMNFDVCGEEIKLVLKENDQIFVLIKFRGRFTPSIGMNNNGIFFNDLMVDSNGEGKYKRQNDKRWIATKLMENLLSGNVQFEELSNLLKEKSIVNGPYTSTHNMISDSLGNVCIIEPGRGNIFNTKRESDFYVMSNFSLTENINKNIRDISGSGADRFAVTHELLGEIKDELCIDSAFEILDKVKQCGEVWKTELSMVFIPKEKQLYFSLDGEFNKRYKFCFKELTIKTDKGFSKNKEIKLTSEGITTSNLKKYLILNEYFK